MTKQVQLPHDWKWVKLGEVCEIVSGNTPKGLEFISNTGEYQFYKISDMNLVGNEIKMNFSNLKLTTEEIKKLKIKVYPKGTVIFPKRGGAILTNKKRVLSKEASFDLNVMGILPNSNISSNYLFYWIQKLDLRKIYDGSNVPQINNKNIAPLEFPLPSNAIQLTIVSKIEELFSELDKGIENIRTAQQQLKTYRQAVLKWAFEGKLTGEWRERQKKLPDSKKLLKQIQIEKESSSNLTGKKLKSLTEITELERLNLPRLPDKWTWVKLGDNAFVTKLAGFEFTKYVNYKQIGDIPVIRAQNVSKTNFVPRNFLYVDRNIMEKLPRSRVYGGEILMVFVGAGLGNVGIVPENYEYFLGPNVAKIALEKQFNNKYIFHFLTSQLGFKNVTGMSKATAQGSISMGNIREVSVPLISFEEQNKIVQEIESRLSIADKMDENITQSLQQAEALRQSILKKAFEGKLI